MNQPRHVYEYLADPLLLIKVLGLAIKTIHTAHNIDADF